jgi:uncharacterized membrane protein
VDEKEWVAKKASMPGPLQFAVDQFARGVTEEWSDEIGGAVGGATSDRVGQRTKDLMRDEQRAIDAQHPVVGGALQVAGSVTKDAVLSRFGVPVGSLPYQVAMGALSGAGAADSNVDTDGLLPTMASGFIGGGLAAATSGLSRLGGKVTGAIRDRAVRGITDAAGDALAHSEALKAKGVKSATGSLGGTSNAVLHLVEKAKAALADPMASPANKLEAQKVLDDPRVADAIKRAYGNAFGDQVGKIGNMSAAEQAVQDALAVDAQALAGDALKDPIKKQILPRAMTYASRLAPAAVGGYVGGEIGGTEGQVAGGLMGGVVGVAMGRPGTAIANAVKHPAVKKAGWETIKTLLADAPEKLGKFAPQLSRALAKSPVAFAVEHFVLSAQDPEARAAFKAAEEEPEQL